EGVRPVVPQHERESEAAGQGERYPQQEREVAAQGGALQRRGARPGARIVGGVRGLGRGGRRTRQRATHVASPEARAGASPSLNTATTPASCAAWCFRLSAAAALSSTSAAFCCVTWSIWLTAWPTWVTPELCSTLAELISPTMSLTRLIAPTISSIV